MSGAKVALIQVCIPLVLLCCICGESFPQEYEPTKLGDVVVEKKAILNAVSAFIYDVNLRQPNVIARHLEMDSGGRGDKTPRAEADLLDNIQSFMSHREKHPQYPLAILAKPKVIIKDDVGYCYCTIIWTSRNEGVSKRRSAIRERFTLAKIGGRWRITNTYSTRILFKHFKDPRRLNYELNELPPPVGE